MLPRETKADISEGNDSLFTSQVIFDCVAVRSDYFVIPALNAMRKWNASRSNKCHLLHGEDLFNKTEKLAAVPKEQSGLMRIYIVGHSAPGVDSIANDAGKRIHFNQLAEALADFIKDQPVEINLMSCFAGRGLKPNHEDSFAAQLHLAINRITNRDIPVVARTTSVHIRVGEVRKFTFDLKKFEEFKSMEEFFNSPKPSNIKNKQPGSKVTYRLDENKQQIRIDSYKDKAVPKWKKQAINTINKCLRNTSIETKKALLEGWLKSFPTQSAAEIYQTIKKEFENPDSVLRGHSKKISKFFKRPTDTMRDLEKLLLNGKEIFAPTSQATPATSTPTEEKKATTEPSTTSRAGKS